jgi:hypothetical protein
MFLNWRFYDPVLQRFITEDPIGTSGGINVFAYSEDDPINAFDPSGLSSDNSDWLYTLAQWSAGAGDTISFGFTNWVRDQLGINDVIDKCSLAYQIGGYTGDVVNYSIMALSLAGPLLEAGAAAAEGIEAAEAIEEAEAVAEETAEIPKSIELTNEQAADILRENGLNPDFLNSFDDGPISLRQVDEGEQFLRYTDDAASPGGSFLTESEFGDSAEAADALYTRPYGNNASFQQLAVANQSTYVLQGGIANGAAGVQQIIVLNRSAFTFSAGYIF